MRFVLCRISAKEPSVFALHTFSILSHVYSISQLQGMFHGPTQDHTSLLLLRADRVVAFTVSTTLTERQAKGKGNF